MAKSIWGLVAAIGGSLALGTATVGAEGREVLINVRVRNDAQVPAKLLARAQNAVMTTYAKAGVRVAFGENGATITVALITRQQAEKLGHRVDVLGFALSSLSGGGKVAYIMMEHVTEQSKLHQVDPGIVLGSVIAHEMGHLLLPYNSHSPSGVMRPKLGLPEFKKALHGNLLFSETQASQLRSR
jgi:hypothetical protein